MRVALMPGRRVGGRKPFGVLPSDLSGCATRRSQLACLLRNRDPWICAAPLAGDAPQTRHEHRSAEVGARSIRCTGQRDPWWGRSWADFDGLCGPFRPVSCLGRTLAFRSEHMDWPCVLVLERTALLGWFFPRASGQASSWTVCPSGESPTAMRKDFPLKRG